MREWDTAIRTERLASDRVIHNMRGMSAQPNGAGSDEDSDGRENNMIKATPVGLHTHRNT